MRRTPPSRRALRVEFWVGATVRTGRGLGGRTDFLIEAGFGERCEVLKCAGVASGRSLLFSTPTFRPPHAARPSRRGPPPPRRPTFVAPSNPHSRADNTANGLGGVRLPPQRRLATG